MRTTKLGVAASVLVMMAGCAEEEAWVPEATRDEVIAACGEYADAACLAFGLCLGQTRSEVDACIARERASCERELQAETCWGAQRDAYLECTDIREDSCDDLCDDDGCFDGCTFFCPPPPQ